MKRLIVEHPLKLYFLLTILFSWTIWSGILFVVPVGELMKSPTPIAIILMLIGGIGPSLTGITLTGITEGSSGVKKLFARVKRLPAQPKMYLAFAIPFILNTGTFIILGFLRQDLVQDNHLAKIIPGIIIGLIAAMSEEFGWRGFALARLQTRYPKFQAGLIVGLFWGLWHTFGNFIALGDMGLLFVPTVILNAFILLTAYSILQTWIYNRAGESMLMVILFHACISSSAFIISRTDVTYFERIQSALVMAILTVITAGVVWLLDREKVFRPSSSSAKLNSPKGDYFLK